MRDVSVCVHEWSQFGSCCNDTQLVAYADQDAEEIREGVITVGKEFRKFAEFIDSSRIIFNELLYIKDPNQLPDARRL